MITNPHGGAGSGASARPPCLTQEQLDAILEFDTCAISNAIESFDVRLRNEGFATPGISCLTHRDARILGYAAPCRVRTDGPPVAGLSYYDRTDWWDPLQTFPQPRISVIQDVSPQPGFGAVIGEVHSAILQAMGCVGAITNGAVRDLDAVAASSFALFAACASPSHAYVHTLDFGQPVLIHGLVIAPGDLLFADRHGILSIPLEVAAEVAAIARRAASRERRIVDLCRSDQFSLARLRQEIKDLGS